ncbi:hypothetical protein CR205_01405 [Alteribacter lacisalsi]|uniref:DUF2507 domain-containing protein n=1 Tax=Alteribacter lacisalsi TaxID=2045244 RepID=A0A2W0HJQ4_9BACI|nr:YslB family protein [Alteribacter lacisalsi]PYZ97292.1 hypothetical protein CR205_01405 [Alteribacter lacisalsi]
MSEQDVKYEQKIENSDSSEAVLPDPDFSLDLIRNDLIPELLGDHEESILYWGGKALARKHTLSTVEETASFFYKAQWGVLKLVKEKKQQQIYELTGTRHTPERSYVSLECGFLAEQIQTRTGSLTEAAYEIQKHKPLTYEITVRWDKKDPVDPPENLSRKADKKKSRRGS